jgi:hypothetical protein
VRSLACGNVQQVKVCSICSLQGHTSDMCPTMQEIYNSLVFFEELDIEEVEIEVLQKTKSMI